jgi:DNA-binding NtrC family response regulator
MDVLVRYAWPGNVRELANAVERALVVGTPPAVRAVDLPLRLNENGSQAAGDSLEDVEKTHIARMLERNEWNMTRTARLLRIDRVTLYNKVKKYDLRRP